MTKRYLEDFAVGQVFKSEHKRVAKDGECNVPTSIAPRQSAGTHRDETAADRICLAKAKIFAAQRLGQAANKTEQTIAAGRDDENHLILAEGDYVILPRAVLWERTSAIVGRRRHCALRTWQARRALGRASGRGDPGGIAERPSDVRRPVPRLTFLHLTCSRRRGIKRAVELPN